MIGRDVCTQFYNQHVEYTVFLLKKYFSICEREHKQWEDSGRGTEAVGMPRAGSSVGLDPMNP